MRKSTKNTIIHGILIIFVIIFAIIASLTAALRDVTVQCMIARSAATELSKRLNADVKIKTFYITNDGTICIENVLIEDLYSFPLFKIGQLNAKLGLDVTTGEFSFKDIYLKDVLGNIVKYEGDEKLNATELFAQLKSGKSTSSSDDTDSDFHLKVDRLQLDNGHVVYWNQNKDKPEKKTMDYAHIDIDSIYGVFSDLEMRQDSVLGKVHTLRGKDRCGLVLKDASGDVLFCEKCLNVDSLKLCTGESCVDLDLRFEYNNSRAYDEFVDSVYMKSNIRESTLLLSDLRYFAWVLNKMPDKFVFTGDYEGKVRNFSVKGFDAYYGENTHLIADVTISGLPEFEETYFDVSLDNLITSYDDIVNMAIPAESVTVPLPEMLSDMGVITTSGSFQGYPDRFNTSFNLESEIGEVVADVYLQTDENPEYSFIVLGNNLRINDVLETNDLSDLSFKLEMYGHGLTVEDSDFEANIDLMSLNFRGNEFKDIGINSIFKDQRLAVNTAIDHRYLNLDLKGAIDLNQERPEYSLKADIKDVDFVNLHLSNYDSIMQLSTNIDLSFSGDEIDNILGNLEINNTKYFNGDKYQMKNFTANVSESYGVKDIAIDCDFFSVGMSGIVNFDDITNALKDNVIHYFDIPSWRKTLNNEFDNQELSFNLILHDTRQLTKLFVPELYVADGTTITASYTNKYYYHGSTIESREIIYNGLKFKNLDVRNTARHREYKSLVMLDDIIIRDTTAGNPDPIYLENVKLLARCSNDTLKVDVLWDDDDADDNNKAFIKSVFTQNDKDGGILSIKSEDIVINDSIWNINPDCSIVFKDNRIAINKLMMFTNTQSLSMNGYFPKHESDTLKMVFYNLDVSDFDYVTRMYDIDLDGVIDGIVGLSGIYDNMSFFSNLELNRLFINRQEVGDASINTSWNDGLKAILIDSEIFKNGNQNRVKSVDLNGYYYTKKATNNLDFKLKFHEFNLETASPFLSSVVQRMHGSASGWVNIMGSVEEPDIVGLVNMKDAGCSVNFLNTYYTFTDKVSLNTGKIVFDNMVLYDTLGHTATVNGFIGHNHLKDIYFDLGITCDNFLALNIPAEQAMGFYGTAITDGTVLIKGPVDKITMNIDSQTKKGTEINIPLSGNSDMDNDFIVFVNKKNIVDTIVDDYYEEKIVKKDNGFTMSLNAEVNPDADVNIFLPMNMGNINARGSGYVNIGVTPNDFNLRGDYLINSGSFVFTLEMIKRTFTLREGGTLRWTGNPADADINVEGVYRTKTSLNTLGSEYVDSTAISNNINVDCIIRLSDKLMNPSISFAIEIPNATDDVKNIVFTAVDTTNQSVMAQQVFSLMVLGSFANTGNADIAHIGTNAGYRVITRQLSNWLSQISKDFDIGIKYTPNDKLTNEELEVALSTQLFDDRLLIEGNFGVIRGNNVNSSDANNLVGDVDITFRLTRRLSLKAYNHTNIKSNYYFYSFENYSDFTQGVGISFSQSFDKIREIFTYNSKKKKAKKQKIKLDDKPKSE